MGHVTEGVLRRYLDEPASVSDVDRGHLASCTRCGVTVRAADADRTAVLTALAEAPDYGPERGPDLDVAWARLGAQLSRDDDAPAPVPLHATRAGRSRRYQVVAGVTAGLLVIGGTAAAAAADWLPIFRTESVTPVSVSMADVTSLSSLAGLQDLADYGDLTMPQGLQPVPVADAAAARARTGLTVPVVGDLPQGVHGTPQFYAVDRATATFTFSTAKAEQAAKAGGVQLPPVPDGLDGSTLKIDAGPGVAQVWAQTSGMPTLVVARLKPPTGSSQGASLVQVRDYLLSLPGIPADLAAQLRTVTGDGTTLPIPVLKGQMSSSQADVNGTGATVVESRGGFGAGVVWIDDGRLTVVAGLLDRDDVLTVARGLH